MMDTFLQNDGWLFHLSQLQYIQLVVVLFLTLILWFSIPALLGKMNRESIGISVALWGIRLVLLLLVGIGIIFIVDFTFDEFLNLPVLVLFQHVKVSPLLVASIVAGIYILLSANNFLKLLVRSLSAKYKIDKKVGRQLRRFLMVFISVLIFGFWLNIAGNVLVEFFGKKLFQISDVNFTPVVLVYLVLILYGIAMVLKLVEIVYSRHAINKGLPKGQSLMVFQIVKYLIWVITIILLLDSIGVSINMLIAGSAALLVGLGFGIQGLFNDYISGFVLLFEGFIKIDDIVEIESTVIGKVVEVGMRTSKIRTRDNIIMIIPNNKLVSDNVINWSYNEPKTRFSVDVGVAYGSDVRLVEKLLLESAHECEEVIIKEESIVLFRDFGESSLDFRLLFWVEDGFMVERVRSKIRFAIDAKFREHDVTIPFPQRDLHLKTDFSKPTMNDNVQP
jgi:small-conductance mechanosensitive channel